MFGYQLFGGKNFIFLNIANAVLPYQIYFHQAIQLRTPSVEINSKIPLNFTVGTPGNCTRLRVQGPCAYELTLFGQMSGAVIQANQKANSQNQIILSSPSQNPRVIMDPYFDGFNLRFSVSKILSNPDNLLLPLLKSPNFVNRLQLSSYQTNANITHQFFIKKPYMNRAVLATVNSLRTVTFQELQYSQTGNRILFTTLLSITIPDLDFVDQIQEIDRPVGSVKPPATFWVIYGRNNGFRRIVVYNVTALYHDNSTFIDFNTEALNNFKLTQSFYPWYVPVKWTFSERHQYFVISYAYGNPYDEPIILFKTDFDNGKIIQIGIINAIILKLNIFSSASFYIHSQYPILIAGGGGPFITIVDLETQSYLYSVSLTDIDPIFASLQQINVQWLNQIDKYHFYAYIQDVGLVELRLSIYSPQDDYDDISHAKISLVQITYQPGIIVYQNGLETPFSQQDNLRACLFKHTPNSGNTTYSLKFVNSYETSRSRIFYEFQLPHSLLCYRPQFFNPFSTENTQHNPGKIFISVICDGQILQYQLYQFSFLELDLSFINGIDPTQFPLTQVLQIKASNLNDVQGVTLDFEVSVLSSDRQLSDSDIGGLSVIILLLIVVFILLGWLIRKQRKSRPTFDDLKSTFAESSESTLGLQTENIGQVSSAPEEDTIKFELREVVEQKQFNISTGVHLSSVDY